MRNAVGAQHQRGGETAAVTHATSRAEQRFRRPFGEEISELRHQRERAPRVAMPTRLGALSDDDSGASIDRLNGVGSALDLANQRDASARTRAPSLRGSPKESITARGFRASSRSSASGKVRPTM
jgi:hypothetical protein